MLEQFRQGTQGIGFKIIVGLLVVVLAVFGFGGFNLFAPTDPSVATINGTSISQQRLQQESQRQLQQLAAQFGANFDPSLIDPAIVQSQALNRLITQELLAQTADRLKLGIAESSISDTLRDNPNFQIDGTFDEDTFRRTVGLAGYTPKGFLETLRRDLTLDRLSQGLIESTVVPRWEIDEAARFMAQRRTVAHLDFTPAAFRESVTVTDQEVEDYYADRLDQYLTPLSVTAQYVQLSVDDLLDDPDITVAETDIQARFDEELVQFADTAELRDSSHILLQINDDRSEEEAFAEIEALRAELEGGADFASLAQARSEDPGSKLQGGSLGPVGKNIFDPDFEAALWALESPGDLSSPVKTAFGVHLIRLEGIETQPAPVLADRRADIVANLKREAAVGLLDERARELDSLAFENPDSLDELVAFTGGSLREATGITEGSGEGPFAESAVREALFSSDVLDAGANSPALRLADGTVLVARVMDQQPPEQKPLDSVAEEIRTLLVSERAEDRMREAQAAALAALKAGAATDAVANEYGLSWNVVENLTQSTADGLDRGILRAAFLAPAPAANDKTIVEADLSTGGRSILAVSDVRFGDYNALSEAEQADLRRALRSRTEQSDFLSVYRTIEDGSNVTRPEALLDG
ncbi:MAG: SurA N-terminal domain-containing protein [Pseudomonadota bacterium]